MRSGPPGHSKISSNVGRLAPLAAGLALSVAVEESVSKPPFRPLQEYFGDLRALVIMIAEVRTGCKCCDCLRISRARRGRHRFGQRCGCSGFGGLELAIRRMAEIR